MNYKKFYEKKFSVSENRIDNTRLAFGKPVYLTYDDYFTSVRWITRDGIVSLSATPNPKMFDFSGPAQGNIAMARAFHSFKLLEDKFNSDYRWKNRASMSAQYHCHFMFAGISKIPWNLEPHRTESNSWSWNILTNRCNP